MDEKFAKKVGSRGAGKRGGDGDKGSVQGEVKGEVKGVTGARAGLPRSLVGSVRKNSGKNSGKVFTKDSDKVSAKTSKTSKTSSSRASTNLSKVAKNKLPKAASPLLAGTRSGVKSSGKKSLSVKSFGISPSSLVGKTQARKIQEGKIQESKIQEGKIQESKIQESKIQGTRLSRSVASSVFSKVGTSTGSGYWQGQMLLASPAIGDTRFERSIVFLCHQGKDGALGLVVNKVAEKIQFTDVLDHLSIPFSSDFESISVHVGGPVESSRGFVLHSPEKKFSGTIELGELAMTASADILKHIALGKGPKDYVFLLGYAGWGTGQLDKEIASNAWLHLPFDSDLIFGEDDGDKWSRAMEQLGISPHLLSGVSGNA